MFVENKVEASFVDASYLVSIVLWTYRTLRFGDKH